MKKQHSLFFFAGEQSGDLQGGSILKQLIQNNPNWSYSGVGGPNMRALGLKGPLMMEDFTVMGFTDVIRSLPKLIRQFLHVRNYILDQNPDGVILIDYPGFNLRLARSLRKKGYTGVLIQYVCPTVWGHGKGRITHMARDLDQLMTLFPFEVDCFKGTTLPALYTGNPILDRIHAESDPYAIGDPTLVAIFPGSRLSEIKINLPIELDAALLFARKHPTAHFGISVAHPSLESVIRGMVDDSPIKERIRIYNPEQHYLLMRSCGLAIATAGTVALELALHRRPTVVCFKISRLNRFIIRTIIRPYVKRFCMVNILLDRELFPELMEIPPTAPLIYRKLEHLLLNKEKIIAGCDEIAQLLKTPIPASERAAQTIEELLL